jgi:hypothetical protein
VPGVAWIICTCVLNPCARTIDMTQRWIQCVTTDWCLKSAESSCHRGTSLMKRNSRSTGYDQGLTLYASRKP